MALQQHTLDGEGVEMGEKGHPKKWKNIQKNIRKKRETQILLRLFEALLGIFSGLADQGLVARCFTVLQYQL